MIKSFRHKGLKEYWEKGRTRKLNSQWLPKITRILNALDVSVEPTDVNIPGFYFHALKGEDKGRYSVRVTGNWRITFEFEGNDAIILDMEDYH